MTSWEREWMNLPLLFHSLKFRFSSLLHPGLESSVPPGYLTYGQYCVGGQNRWIHTYLQEYLCKSEHDRLGMNKYSLYQHKTISVGYSVRIKLHEMFTRLAQVDLNKTMVSFPLLIVHSQIYNQEELSQFSYYLTVIYSVF